MSRGSTADILSQQPQPFVGSGALFCLYLVSLKEFTTTPLTLARVGETFR